MHGSGNHKLGDPVYLIEVVLKDGTSIVKVFPSESGFKAGMRAARDDVKHPHIPAVGYRTYIMTNPKWMMTDEKVPDEFQKGQVYERR